jgi:hypothetical protein
MPMPARVAGLRDGGSEPLISRKELEEGKREEGTGPTQGGELGSHGHLGQRAGCRLQTRNGRQRHAFVRTEA